MVKLLNYQNASAQLLQFTFIKVDSYRTKVLAIRQAECPTFEISFENLDVQALLMQLSHALFVVLGKVISLNKKRPLAHACVCLCVLQ